MSSEYRIAGGDFIELTAREQSGKFDLDVDFPSGTLTLLGGIGSEHLAEVGFELLQAAMFNCADSDAFEKWLHERVRELSHGS